MRRARSPSPLGSSPLAKRRRGEAGEVQKSNLDGFDRARFNEVDDRIDNLYEQYGITTDINSLTIDDSNSFFAEEFEVTSPLYKQDGVLESDFFQSEMLCDSESQERLEEREGNQNDSAEDTLTDLPTAHTYDWLADEDCEMSSGGESEANHAALSVNDFPAVEENTAQQAKLKSAKRVKWTSKLREIAKKLIEENANADPKLKGTELHILLKAKCDAHKPKLECPGYNSFREECLKKIYETPVRWTSELRAIAKKLIEENANADPKLKGTELHVLLKAKCDAHKPKLECPGYVSFWAEYLKKSHESSARWTPDLREIAKKLIEENASADPKLSGVKLHVLLKARCDAHEPKLACPSYPSFWKEYLAKL
ncbi:Uncharacterized protein MCB1EB_1601 [Mycoavidus cysteinexigens]|uniref:Uncharacterized protein n=2 Tax=Mycoavidus cysteinexigens TaxID=1553431 RepID=A0A2Z6EWI0_9BURK|nr:Uncharacterized protein MCB1EB_1601 [Mycoavidus cysteinexigens]GLR01097.1 hypothetical protein GCM10007934_09090 [Mycoavidus cysteinexigens]